MRSPRKSLPFAHIGALALAAVLSACGSTSTIKLSDKPEAVIASPEQKQGGSIDVSGYDKVIVLDFVDAIDKSSLSPDKARSLSATTATAVRTFPDLIAQRLRDTGAFKEVVRGPSPGKALRVSGRITRLVEGSGSMRFWVGMGAGSSFFGATTELSDAESGESLGQVTTSKNSWALGGAIAATQTVDTFMQGAAEKIASDLRDSKKGALAAKAH